MTLLTVTDDGYGFAFDKGQVTIFVVKNLHEKTPDNCFVLLVVLCQFVLKGVKHAHRARYHKHPCERFLESPLDQVPQ